MSQESNDRPRSEIDEYVWSNHKPWVPRPLLSMHVRMGDKAGEMKVVEFEEYMQLADQIRSHFPNLNSIWLSTEMQVIMEFRMAAVKQFGLSNQEQPIRLILLRWSESNYQFVRV